MKKLSLLLFGTLSFSMSSQSLAEKIDDIVRIPYKKVELKVDFVVDPNAVTDMHIDEYQFDFDSDFERADTIVKISHFLNYKDGKLISNAAEAGSSDTSLPKERLEKLMTYDSSGRLSKIVTTIQDGEKTVFFEKLKYSGDTIDRHYYTMKDTVNPEKDKVKYYLDDDNYIIQEFTILNKFASTLNVKYNQKKDIIFTDNGRNTIKYEHSYEFGNKIQTKITVTYASESSLNYTSIQKFIFDSNNNLVKEISDEEANSFIEYTYKDNRLAALSKISKGKLFSQNIYKYDDLGNWNEIEFIENSFENIPYTVKVVKRKINYKG